MPETMPKLSGLTVDVTGVFTADNDKWAVWVGTDTPGDTILDSQGVSSITDNGTGDYTVNFTNSFLSPFPSCSATMINNGVLNAFCVGITVSASSFNVSCMNADSGSRMDIQTIHVRCVGK